MIYAIIQVVRDQETIDWSFKTNYLSNPWTLPKPDTLVDREGMMGMASPLSTAKVAYQVVQEKITDTCSSNLADEERNIYPMPILSMSSSIESDPLDTELFVDETIMEVMCPIEKPWEISHHRSSFIPTTDQLKKINLELTIDKKFDWFKCPFPAQSIIIEGNLSNISNTIPTNISSNTDVIENIMIGVDCSP